MITIAHGSPYTIWVPLDNGVTAYVGSLICFDTSDLSALDGIVVREQADGTGNNSNYDLPYGVVIGTNEKTSIFDTSHKTDKITQGGATDPHDGATREYVGVEGPWSKGDGNAMVKVAIITPSTILRAPIYNDAVGTAPTELTTTTADTNGLSITTTATSDFTPVAGMNTIYCRKGANAGIYRRTYNTDTSIHTTYTAFPKDIDSGSVWVTVPVVIGPSYVRFGDNTVCSYINCSETPASHYDIIIVTRLDLREAGKEFAEFYFASEHFTPAALR